uniref:Arylsulfatase n=1 Tax=uncultured prokaryote TaxID=198431 RepID=A0A0H5QIB1_9ZZZZ|nr:hypothetical protein [uncultured prokaryote]
MKNILFTLITLVAVCTAQAQDNREREKNTLRIMSYNIRNGNGMDGRQDLTRTAEVINRLRPGVVALQEVDSMTNRSGKVDVMARLGAETLMHPVFAPAINYDGGKYGIGLLCSERPLDVRRVPLPGREEERTLLMVEFDRYVMCCTHLSLTPEDQLASVDILAKETARTGKPCFVAGDMNAQPDEATIIRLKRDFRILSKTDKPTYPADKPTDVIDYIAIAAKDTNTYTRTGAWVADAPAQSDHRPIVTDVILHQPKDRIFRTKPYLMNPTDGGITVLWQTTVPTHSCIMAATADRVPCVFIENGRVANYDPSAPIHVNYRRNYDGEPTGRDNPELLYNLRSSHGHDQSIINGIGRIGYMKGGGKALWKDEDIADSIAAHAVQYIRQHSGEPFFMYLCTNDIHVPRFPHERFRGKNRMGLRGDAIASFDWTVGQVLSTLDSLRLTDNTLIMLSSDNGPVLDDGYDDRAEELVGEHSPTGHLRGGKYSAFEGGTRIPLIVHWPARVHKAESEALVSQIDFLASLAALTGARIPEHHATDSRDALPALLGQDKQGREWALEQASNHTLSIRTLDWKYIEPSDGSPVITWGPAIETGYNKQPQLYRMGQDAEQTNQAAQHPEIVNELSNLLQQIRKNE